MSEVATNQNDMLLRYISEFAEFMLNAEADAICGAPRRSHSTSRVNYRAGYHTRMLKLQVGTVRVRVPNLRYLHLRPGMCKRFKRLEPLLVGTLEHTLRFGIEVPRIAELVRELWTLALTPQQYAALVTEAVTHLGAWQRDTVLREAMSLYAQKYGAQAAADTPCAVQNGADPEPGHRQSFAYAVY